MADWVLVENPFAPSPLLTGGRDPRQARELEWLLGELHETLKELKHGLEDCYALLAPVDPGSTLLVSTPRNEIVKGHITRVGTRIVKGVRPSPPRRGFRVRLADGEDAIQTLHLKLRTAPPQTLSINPDRPIHLASLETLHTLLTHSIDLVNLTVSYSYPAAAAVPHVAPLPAGRGSTAPFVAAQLRLLSQSLAEASALLRGPPLTDADPAWTSRSAAPACFDPPLAPLPAPPPPGQHHHLHHSAAAAAGGSTLSFHLGLQDSQLVLWLRALEPADAPVNLGMKFALAIGTARRLEHDESDRVFRFAWDGAAEPGRPPPDAPAAGPPGVDVFVREKLRIETPDPSLLSLSAKLASLSHTLSLARGNLAAVMGEDLEE